MSTLFLGVEDELSAAVGKAILRHAVTPNAEIKVLGKKGNGYLKASLGNFMELAGRYIVLVMTDLDNKECAPTLRADWMRNRHLPERMSIRVAVKEVEAWLMADRESFANYLGVSAGKVPRDVENVQDPKEKLLLIAAKGKREIRDDLLPRVGARVVQGLGYNARLCQFVEEHWNIDSAAAQSDSLNRAIRSASTLREFLEE